MVADYVEGRGRSPMGVLSWNFVGGTEENHRKRVDSRCLGQDSNHAVSEYKYKALPLADGWREKRKPRATGYF
jgi:hypothetical protein